MCGLALRFRAFIAPKSVRRNTGRVIVPPAVSTPFTTNTLLMQISTAQSQKINLRTFYPILAYLVDYFRRVGEPNTPFHPAMQSKILQAPIPAPRKAPRPNERLRQVVVLGEEYHLEQPGALANWWHGKQGLLTGVDDQMKLMFQVLREINTFEITIAICLVLLTDLYSAEDPLDDGPAGPYYRLEYGQDPISDFGICKGKIRGTTHYVQVWAYRDAKTGTEHTYNDPDNHYWIYFKTLTGDEVTLDCNSYSFGMETLVDVETLIKKIPDYMVIDYNTRVPALLRGRMDRGAQPYALIEEKRFSVMRDTRLHQAILTRFPNDDTPEDKRIIREFMEKVLGQEVEKRQEDRLWRYRMFGSLMLREVLEGQMWKSLGKPIIHRTDNFLSPRPLRMPNYSRT